MKKLFTLLITALIILTLSSCKVTIKKEMQLGGEIDDIISINIYEVEREEYIGSDIDDSVLDIRNEYEPVCTLVGDEIDGFHGLAGRAGGEIVCQIKPKLTFVSVMICQIVGGGIVVRVGKSIGQIMGQFSQRVVVPDCPAAAGLQRPDTAKNVRMGI